KRCDQAIKDVKKSAVAGERIRTAVRSFGFYLTFNRAGLRCAIARSRSGRDAGMGRLAARGRAPSRKRARHVPAGEAARRGGTKRRGAAVDADDAVPKHDSPATRGEVARQPRS